MYGEAGTELAALKLTIELDSLRGVPGAAEDASRESRFKQKKDGPVDALVIMLLGTRLPGTVRARGGKIRPMLGVPLGDGEAHDGRRRTTAGAVWISAPLSAKMRSRPRELLPKPSAAGSSCGKEDVCCDESVRYKKCACGRAAELSEVCMQPATGETD